MKNLIIQSWRIIALLLCYLNSQSQESLTLDLKAVPFSRFGSFLAVSARTDKEIQNIPGLFIHDVSGKNMWKWNGVFKIEPLQNGKPLEYKTFATPSKITITSDAGSCEICFEDKNTLRFRTVNMDIGITSFMAEVVTEGNKKGLPYNFPFQKGQWLIPNFVLTSIKGNAENKPDEKGFPSYVFTANNSKTAEFAIEFYESGWKEKVYNKSFNDCVKESEKELSSWISKYPDCDKKYLNARDLALYINWSSVVSPRDNMTQYGMLMSKNFMNSIWSWDNCFNAIATAYAYPDLAWAQIELMFEHQNERGALPDALNDYNNVWAFEKPPIYGIVLDNLIQRKIVNEKQFADIYDHVVKLTNFWFTYRDLNRNGIPEYFHGNDSGWDNATMFDVGFAVESADLCSFLIYQMDFLSEMAKKLGKQEESKTWKIKADKVLEFMLSDLWVDNHFVAKNVNTGKWNEKSQSLLSYIPIILGKRLPKEFREKLISELKKSGNLTTYGLATENPNSPLYTPDGYWRGPIWAPTTWLIIKGLDKSGEKAYATEIAKRYCDLCKKSGFPENFDALTGEPLRDLAYTWTSSVFIALLNDYMNK